MLNRIFGAAVAIAISLLPIGALAAGGSTINRGIPAPNAPLSSAPINQNFNAAANDINNLMSQFASGIAPQTPLTGQIWLNTGLSPNPVNEWDGATWVAIGYIDAVNHQFIPQSGGGLNNIAAATTTDLGSLPQTIINVTGSSVSISSFGSSAKSGQMRYVTFAGVNTISSVPGQMNTPGAVDITTAAGDWGIMLPLGSGQWSVAFYQKASGITSGTVTSVSVTTANGVSGTVATATSTPAITITLGAITPTSVNGNTVPTGSDIVALLAASQAFTNKTYNGMTVTSSTGTFALANGKTLTVSNTMTQTATDGSTVAFTAGGTVDYLGSTAPFTATKTFADGSTWSSTALTVAKQLITKSVGETPVALSGCAGPATATIDLSAGTVFACTVSAGAVTFAVSNVISGKAMSFVLRLTNGGSQTTTFMSGSVWPGGKPTFTTSGKDVVVCYEDDGSGTAWYCSANLNYSLLDDAIEHGEYAKELRNAA